MHEFVWQNSMILPPKKTCKLLKADEKRYILEVDIEYPKKPKNDHKKLLFLVEKIKIGKMGYLVTNLMGKMTYIMLNTRLRTTAKERVY